jgi:hypothetical protein
LINELEYKVIKAMFSVNKVSDVEIVNLVNDENLEVNEEDLEALLESFSNKKQTNENPLFVDQNIQKNSRKNNSSDNNEVKKIRV